ncbi:MAG: hypothetical protein ACYC2H_03935 [Thermoplasmatota archaeon]
MAKRTLGRDLLRASLAIIPALFLAGAAVSARLHLRIARHGGRFALLEVLEQGFEIAIWFGLFVLAAAVIVAGLSRLWVPKRARRLAMACATFAIAFVLFQMVFWVLDGLAVLYLAAGALAYGLTSAEPPRPSRQDEEAPRSLSTTDAKAGPPRLRPSES